MHLLRASRIQTLAAVAVLLPLLSACGGTSEAPRADPSPSASPSSTPSDIAGEVVQQFQAADTAQAAAFASAEVTIQAGRGDQDLAMAQAGGAAARDALFDFDAALRNIAFPETVQPAVTELLSSISEAIAALDEQNSAADQQAYLASDDRTGSAVEAVRAATAAVRTSLGLPPAPPPVPSPTPSEEPAFVSKQEELSPGYLDGTDILDAESWRDDLLAVGTANVDASNTYSATESYSFGIVEAWSAAFPFLDKQGVDGSAVAAQRSGISGFTVLAIDSKKKQSATNPAALPFAVMDASGSCAAGVLYGADVPDRAKALTLPAGAKCTGNAAREAAIAAGFR